MCGRLRKPSPYPTTTNSQFYKNFDQFQSYEIYKSGLFICYCFIVKKQSVYLLSYKIRESSGFVVSKLVIRFKEQDIEPLHCVTTSFGEK